MSEAPRIMASDKIELEIFSGLFTLSTLLKKGGNKVKSIAIVGFMGAGKTTIGKELSSRLHTSFIDVDAFIEKKTKKTIEQIFQESGEIGFREIETEVLKQLPLKNAVISTGGGIVIKEENRKILNNFYVIWLDVEFEVILKRLKNDHTRPLWKQPIEKRLTLYNERRKLYQSVAHLHLKIADESIDEVIEKIINQLYL